MDNKKPENRVAGAVTSLYLRHGRWKSNLFLGALALIAVLAAVSAFLSLVPQPKGDYQVVLPSGKTCSERGQGLLMREAAELLDWVPGSPKEPSRVDELHAVAGKIKELEQHESDPSCLYVLTRYAINTSNHEEAQGYYDKLSEAYRPGVTLDEDLGPDTLSLDDLKGMLDFLKDTQEGQDALNFGGPEV